MSGEIVDALTARSPRRLIEELAQLGRALVAAGRARPEVTLSLRGGAPLHGRILALGADDDRGGPTALIAVGGTPRAPAVAFVRLDEIAAITVADAALLVHAPIADGPAPSRLELGRQAAARSEPLASRLGRPLPVGVAGDLDDDGRRAVGAVLPLVFDVLGQIAGDELGRAALAGLGSVELRAAASRELWLEPASAGAATGGTLVIRAPTLVTDAFTAASLRLAIEKLL